MKDLEESFSIDRRSLALMRALLATFVVVDLGRRAADVTAFYTDVGAVPRAFLVGAGRGIHWSLHALGGGAGFELALFAVAGLFALALFVGWHTRLATLALWVLTVSLHNRNDDVLISGDKVLRLILFWSFFLPLGDRWSLDARRTRRPADRSQLLSIAGAALLVQVVAIYPATVYHKLQQSPWQELTMVGRMLEVDGITSPLGRLLRHLPPFVFRALTFWTLAIEALAPLVALLRVGKTRTIAVLVMLIFHGVLLGSVLYLGLFPFIMVVAWSVFLPPWFWDVAVPAVATSCRRVLPALEGPIARLQDGFGRLDEPSREAAAPSKRWQAPLRQLSFAASAAFGAIALFDLVASASRPRPTGTPTLLDECIEFFRLDATRGWELFPTVMTNRYYVYAATLADGTKVDLHRDAAPLDWNHPSDRSKNNIWWKFQLHLSDQGERYGKSFSYYLAKRWEDEHPDRPIEALDLVMLERPDGAPKLAPLRNVSLWHQEFVGGRTASPLPAAHERWEVGQNVLVNLLVSRERMSAGACVSGRAFGARRCGFAPGDVAHPLELDPANVLRPVASERGVPLLVSGDAAAALPAGAVQAVVACVFTVDGWLQRPVVRWDGDEPWLATKTEWPVGALSACHGVSSTTPP